MPYGDTLDALADANRRIILEVLSQGERPVGRIADLLPISRPAVSQHLQVLKRAGLVRERRQGTRNLYRVDPAGLAPLRAYLDRFWGDALDAYQKVAQKTAQPKADEKRNP